MAEAAAAYAKAAELAPRHADFHFFLGHIRYVQGDRAAAVAAMEAGPKLNPAHAGARSELAELLYSQERFADALSHYDRVFELSPQPSPAISAEEHSRCRWHAAHCSLDVSTNARTPLEQSLGRRRAIELLRAALTGFETEATTCDDARLAAIRRVLSSWKHAAAFATIRAPEPLETYPPAEREDCERFLRDVDALLAKLDEATHASTP